MASNLLHVLSLSQKYVGLLENLNDDFLAVSSLADQNGSL